MDLKTIQDHPAFRQLSSERTRLGVGMSIVMVVAYSLAQWNNLVNACSLQPMIEPLENHCIMNQVPFKLVFTTAFQPLTETSIAA